MMFISVAVIELECKVTTPSFMKGNREERREDEKRDILA